jgi:glycine/D-amino acid oxidase-like deaminating enzyme
MQSDVIVIGAGTVGASIAYGLARRGQRVTVLDGDDADFRAARANFGLVWLQGKGASLPAYQALTRNSVDRWPGFCDELSECAAMDLQYERKGGLDFCIGDAAFDARMQELKRLHNQPHGLQADWEMVDRTRLANLLPGITLGREVAGATFGKHDGHTNPLRLLAALQKSIQLMGGQVLGGHAVSAIRKNHSGFTMTTAQAVFTAPRLVISAGLGSRALAAQVGIDVPLRPQRGQILVTEKLAPFLPLPANTLRQTREGAVMIGATHEEVGLDASATANAAGKLSSDAVRIIPALASVTLVRQWGGLRIMTPDGYPVYAQSPTCPGAFVALCHSGVTLAAFHADMIAEAVIQGALPASLDPFHSRRFDVPQAA